MEEVYPKKVTECETQNSPLAGSLTRFVAPAFDVGLS
jgi:hypothetical protein